MNPITMILKCRIFLLFLLQCFVLFTCDAKYPEDCNIYVDEVCYEVLGSYSLPGTAKDECQGINGRFESSNWSPKVIETVSNALKDRYEKKFWISFEKSSGYPYGRKDRCVVLDVEMEIHSNLDNCFQFLPSICMFSTNNCQLSTLKTSITNVIFKNCKNESMSPMTEVTIECKQGYILQNGENIIKCRYDGKWSHTPKCTPGCLPPTVPKNALLISPKEIYNVGENSTLVCLDGFISFSKYPVTHASVTCLNDSTWFNMLPDCLPVDNLSYRYGFMKNKQFDKTVAVGSEIDLPVCNVIDKANDWKIVWLKDQLNILEFQEGERIFMDGNFSLHLSNFSFMDEGVYICLIKNRTTSSIGEFCTYQVKVAKDCSEGAAKHLSIVLQEGTNQIITCNADSFIYKTKWFKDGRQLWGDSNRFPLADGSLYIQNISIDDRGNYLCKYHNTFCSGEMKLSVSVNMNIVCGRFEAENTSVRPWLATLWNEGEVIPFCYATLIDSSWLVTSATCLFGTQRKRRPGFTVKLGASSDSFEDAPVYEVAKVKLHPRYSKRLSFYDVALIKLEKPVVYTNNIYPICFLGSNLQGEDSCNEFQSGTTTGWGPLGSVEEISNLKLNSEILNIVDRNDCKHSVRYQLPEYMFCAKGKEDLHSIAGDSGSSFEIKWKNRWYLWGVLSWGDRAYAAGDYDYFSKTLNFENWIQTTMKSFTTHEIQKLF